MRCKERFVFPRDENVPDATSCESDRRAARACVEDGGIAIDPAQKITGFGLVIAVLAHCIAPGGHEIPARTS